MERRSRAGQVAAVVVALIPVSIVLAWGFGKSPMSIRELLLGIALVEMFLCFVAGLGCFLAGYALSALRQHRALGTAAISLGARLTLVGFFLAAVLWMVASLSGCAIGGDRFSDG